MVEQPALGTGLLGKEQLDCGVCPLSRRSAYQDRPRSGQPVRRALRGTEPASFRAATGPELGPTFATEGTTPPEDCYLVDRGGLHRPCLSRNKYCRVV